ncbi:MAG: hypothetical protein HRT69_13140 [Flavobacteriaceae bacterium]|nr:hypothetical protein [Flavobacteriaceae bacterium]
MKKIISLSISFLLLIFISCKNKPDSAIDLKTETSELKNWKEHWEIPMQKEKLLANQKLHYRIKECLKDTTIIVLTSTLINNLTKYSKIKSLGDINNNSTNDSILVIPELFISDGGGVEDGASVIFTNKNIPRIRVDVSCLDTDYIFPVADINNDGVIELGKYYTSCSSRFKLLELISLNQNEWKVKGLVTFDIFYEEPQKEERIEKIGLNKFRMREITSEDSDEKTDAWKIFEMK